MIGGVSGVVPALIGLGLLVFGWLYNRRVARLVTEGYAAGYTSLIVAAGVAVTLLGLAALDVFLDWNAGLQGLLAFGLSGAPMIWGSISRHVRLREKYRAETSAQIDRLLRELLHHDEP